MGLTFDLQVDKARALLGKSRHRSVHIMSTPWQDLPAFYASLSEPTITHLALRFLILTGLRSRPVRFLRFDQVEGDVLTVPGEMMKGLKDRTSAFRVPLSPEALRVIELARPFERDGHAFPSERKGVIVATDSDDNGAGRKAGEALAERAAALGWSVSLFPAPAGHDWNDVLQAMKEAAA